jgi:hypothetical protein
MLLATIPSHSDSGTFSNTIALRVEGDSKVEEAAFLGRGAHLCNLFALYLPGFAIIADLSSAGGSDSTQSGDPN